MAILWWAREKDAQPLDRFDALDLLVEVNDLIQAQKYGAAMRLLGMTPEMFAPEQTIEELAQVVEVRMAALAKQAGVKL